MTTRIEHPGLGGGRVAPEGERSPTASPRARRTFAVSGIGWVIAAAIVVVLLYVHRTHTEAHQRKNLEDERNLGLRVSVRKVTRTPVARTLTLPGDVHGYDQATIYAKLSGYVGDVRVQRGQRVRKGDVLATIESPESEKDVAVAEHDLSIASINAKRAARLSPSGVVTEQDRDNAVAQQRVAGASLARARDVYAYTVVRAPFDGVVTARYVDPGALVPAATGATSSALPVVDLADIDTLRVFVNVGQDAAPFVHVGDSVAVWQDELPDRRVDAKVSFSTGNLDPRTRTLQVEIDLDNRTFGMLPGTFAHVDLHLEEPASAEIPDEAIVIRDGATQACVIAGGKAHYVPVDLGYNDGENVRVLHGLSGDETIGIDVPVEVQEGDTVRAIPSPEHKR